MPATLSCADCGKPMYRAAGSLPQGQARCQPCRRQAWGLEPGHKVIDWKAERAQTRPRLAQCRRCDAPVPPGRMAYCSAHCARKRKRLGIRPSAAARGYGSQHQRLRAELLPQAYGQDCHLCGAVMLPNQELHLDHTPDRTDYRGMAHAWCNSLDGRQRAREAQRRKRLGVSV